MTDERSLAIIEDTLAAVERAADATWRDEADVDIDWIGLIDEEIWEGE